MRRPGVGRSGVKKIGRKRLRLRSLMSYPMTPKRLIVISVVWTALMLLVSVILIWYVMEHPIRGDAVILNSQQEVTRPGPTATTMFQHQL